MNVTKALSSPEKEKWIDAVEEEMHSIKANKVWELVKLPEGKKTVGYKWVFNSVAPIIESVIGNTLYWLILSISVNFINIGVRSVHKSNC